MIEREFGGELRRDGDGREGPKPQAWLCKGTGVLGSSSLRELRKQTSKIHERRWWTAGLPGSTREWGIEGGRRKKTLTRTSWPHSNLGTIGAIIPTHNIIPQSSSLWNLEPSKPKPFRFISPAREALSPINRPDNWLFTVRLT